MARAARACVKSSHSFERYPNATRVGYSTSAKQTAVIPPGDAYMWQR